ncbi:MULTISPECIES: DedA family protein [Catenuloplanes]|uniref:Membrane protein DedA with SNARE-associated domain n=1 Tax=Catenuloplanes niger TaxID=587534 RepID=A0AAE4CPE3_9ACTN|nr:DedA family protein [Catenuloplanes niger]MDR7320531.1 membrane protein DedA with SNARE-associated domain [Catenuloplanes niger]
MNIESLWQTDLIALISPVMTSPLLYPLLVALGGLDGIVPIIPSEAALITAGLFSRTGTPVLLLVVLASAAGVVVGDHLVYALSRSAFGPRLLGRFPRIGAAVDAGGRQLARRAGRVIVISRFVPGGRVTTNIACGTTRLPLSRFSPASAIAGLAWAAYHGGLGVLGGAAFIRNPLLGLVLCLAVSSLAGAVVTLAQRLHSRRAARAPREGRGTAFAPAPSRDSCTPVRPRPAGAVRVGLAPRVRPASYQDGSRIRPCPARPSPWPGTVRPADDRCAQAMKGRDDLAHQRRPLAERAARRVDDEADQLGPVLGGLECAPGSA